MSHPGIIFVTVENISPENSEFSSASLSGTDIALPNSKNWGKLTPRGIGQAQCHRTLLWPRLALLPLTAPATLRLVNHRSTGRLDLHRHHHCRSGCPTSRPS